MFKVVEMVGRGVWWAARSGWYLLKSPYGQGAITGASVAVLADETKDSVSEIVDTSSNALNAITGAAVIGLVIWVATKKR